ncbi:MAG TPA: tail fiber domain-containing protein [Terriglobales bacterium]|nr:tail fiber domain-containing protein [Terriglobales bacterium]
MCSCYRSLTVVLCALLLTLAGVAQQPPTEFVGFTTDQIVKVTQQSTGGGLKATASSKAVEGKATATQGTATGVEGVTASEDGVGVLGDATADAGNNEGVKGTSASHDGIGVRATDTATFGTTTGLSAWVSSPDGVAGVFHNTAGGKIISGHAQNKERFSVDGSGNVNTVSTYQIGGHTVMSTGDHNDWNLFLGVQAGKNNVASQQQGNTFTGYQAGLGSTTGNNNSFYGAMAGAQSITGSNNTFLGASAGLQNDGGYSNTFAGASAGSGNIEGYENTFVGKDAGAKSAYVCCNTFLGAFAGAQGQADYNTIIGHMAGYSNIGDYNTFTGRKAGYANQGTGNTFTGDSAGEANTTGLFNAFFGSDAGGSTTTGSRNSFFGASAGYHNTSGSDDVYISSYGPDSGTESNTIRIGDPSHQQLAFIAGISNTNVTGSAVYVTSSGQLGVQSSSRRFKEQISDMGDSTSALMKLRPVSFLYKPEYSSGEGTRQYGLIAEEVAAVYPELVTYDSDGHPFSVRYQYLAPMLLNQVQQEHRRAEAEASIIQKQQEQISGQQETIVDLERRLSRLESLIGASVDRRGQF